MGNGAQCFGFAANHLSKPAQTIKATSHSPPQKQNEIATGSHSNFASKRESLTGRMPLQQSSPSRTKSYSRTWEGESLAEPKQQRIPTDD
jgi:hypothetical protein